jgi:hypothetical protein
MECGLEKEILSDMPTGYGSSIEALRDLRSSNNITKMSTNLIVLENGIKYSSVEVTRSDGIQYGLQAYGNEALGLNKVAQEIIPKEQEPKMLVLS